MKNNLTLLAREGKAKASQNTGGGTSQQSTAQHDSARVFKYFNTQMARFLWNKKGEATVSKSSCSWAQGRATSAEQPTNHALITHLSPTQTVSLARIWKYVACMLMVLFMGVGNVWGATDTTFVAGTSKGQFSQSTTLQGSVAKVVTNSTGGNASSRQIWKDGQAAKSETAIQLSSSADNDPTQKYIEISVASGYKITGLTVRGAIASTTAATYTAFCWAGDYSTETGAVTGTGSLAFPGYAGSTSAGADVTMSGIVNGTRTIRIYRRVKYNSTSKTIGNITGAANTPSSAPGNLNVASITVTYEVVPPSCSEPAAPTISGTAAYTEGQTISLTASHDGSNHSATTTYTWYKGADWATASAAPVVQAAATGSSGYTFTKANCVTGDAGIYWCEAANSTCKSHNATGFAIAVTAAPVANPVITAAVNEAGWGSVSPASITVTSGDAVSIDGAELTCGGKTLTATATTATAEYTYTFVNWTGVSNGDEITANTTATANFSRTANSYAVNYTAPTNGSYTIKVGDASAVSANTTAAYGTTVTLAATPASGYKFTGWTVAKAAGTVTVTNNQFTMPAEAVTVSAAFEQVCYLTLYDLVGEVGSAEVTVDNAAVNEGESLVMSNTDGRIKLTPVSGQKIKNGDEIVFTGTVGAAENKKKPFGIKIYAQNGTTSAGDIKTAEDKWSGDGAMTLSGTLSNLGDGADYIYIARSGGTTTTLTSCVVRREITCPEELDAITGLAVSATTSTSLTFEWDAVTNASSYDVYLYEDEECETLVGSKANVTGESKTFTGLTPNTDYYCKVQAIGDGVSYTDGPLSDYLNGKTDEAPKYNVTYASAKGVAPAAAEQVYSVVLPQISPVTGFVHTGWTAGQTVVVDEETVTAGTTIAIGKTAVLSANTTFTAVWSTAYTLTLDPKGGTIVDAAGWTYDNVNDKYTKAVVSGGSVDLPVFTKDDRTFKTWRNNADAEDEYAEEGSVTVSADMTLNAIWNATVEQVIYSWEGAESGAIEFGGTAVGSEAGLVNTLSEGYYCLRMNGNTSYDIYVEITLSGDEKIKTGDKITYLGFYSNASDKNASPKMRDSNGSQAEIFADPDNLPKINGGVGTPAQRTFTVPEGINTNKVQMTRSKTGSSTMMPKIRIYREVTTEEDNIKTVTFNSNGGSDVAAAEVISGKVVAKPANPTRAGYRFKEWQLSGSAYNFSTAVTANITLDAVWTQLYAVTYAAGEGSGTMAADEAAAGDKVTLKANGFTPPTGKVFDAWVVAPTAGGDPISVTAGKFTMPAAAVTATATWKATYTVNYIDEDGSTPLGSEEVAVGSHPTAAGISAEQDYKTLTWLLSDEPVDLDEVSAAAGETVELVASYAPAYASSINIEQWVLDNKVANKAGLIAELEGKGYKQVDLNALDSLNDDPSKANRNYAFLGMKVNKATSAISFLLKSGSTVKARFGNMGNNVNVTIGEAEPVELTSGSYANTAVSGTREYSYTAAADVIVKFQSTDTKTVVFKQIMIDEDIASMTLPAIVTYDANGGSFGKTSEKYTGTPLVIGDATPADEDYEFEGWHVGSVEGDKIDASAYEPTANVTLVAKYVVKPSPFSLTALTYQIGAGAATAVGYVEGTYEYDVELPYAGSYETITVAYTLAEGTSSEKTGAVLSVTSVPGAATFTVVAVNETEKTYTVNFKKAAKDGLSIIKATISGGNETAGFDAEGLYAGKGYAQTASKKLNTGGAFVGVQLKAGETFQAGDKLYVVTSTDADRGYIELYQEAAGTNLIKATGVRDASAGIALPSEAYGLNEIYIVRKTSEGDQSWNGTVNYVEVKRPMNPVLKSITFDGTKIDVAGTTVEETLPYATDLTAVTAEYYWNGAGTAVVTTNAGAWAWGDNTYVLTDKDGDATTYTITLVRATRSSDKSLSSLTVDGNAVELKEGVYDYIYEYPYGTAPATVPVVAAVANEAHASVGTITQAASTAGTASFTVTAEDETSQDYTVSFKISRVPGLVIYDGSTGATAFTATSYEDEDTHFAWSIGSSISVSADNAPASSTWGGKTYTKMLKNFKPKNGNNEVSFTVPSGYLAKIRLVGSTNNDGNVRKMFIAEEATSDDSKAIGNYVITSSTYEAQGFVTELLMPGTYYLGSTDSYRLFEFSAQLYPIDKTRTGLAQGMLGTVCLPNGGIMVGASIFEIACMDYEADGRTPHKIYFDEVLGGVMEAGMPYVILPNEGSSQFVVTYTDNANAAAQTKKGLVGYLGVQRALAANDYFIYNNMFYYVSSEDAANERIRISAEHAYINLSQVPGYNHESPKPASVGRRRISMGNANPAPQVATGMDEVQGNNIQSTKVMIDGQLFIIHGEKMYNATGILVK